MAEQMTATQNGVAEFDFGYAELKTVDFVLGMLRGADGKNPPVLKMRSVEDNPEYLAEFLRVGGSRRREKVKQDARRLEESRPEVVDDMVKQWQDSETEIDDDLKAYPGTVIVGWENMPNANGEEVPWSVENCRAFLAALREKALWIFKRVRNFALTSTNYVDRAPFPSEVKVAGN